MGDLELVVERAKHFESRLERDFGAKGRGLHQKVSSVASRLPDGTTGKLRFIATVRNKLVHEEGYQRVDDRNGFLRACEAAERELDELSRAGGGGRPVLLRWIARLASLAVLGFLGMVLGEGGGARLWERLSAEPLKSLALVVSCAGLVWAWRREVLGGLVGLAGIGLLLYVEWSLSASLGVGWLVLPAVPAVLFLAAGIAGRGGRR